MNQKITEQDIHVTSPHELNVGQLIAVVKQLREELYQAKLNRITGEHMITLARMLKASTKISDPNNNGFARSQARSDFVDSYKKLFQLCGVPEHMIT